MTAEKGPFDQHFDSLETLAETISEVLRCPVTIEDANHRLVAYSAHDRQTDEARTATIIGRRVPEKVVQSLWRQGVIPQLMKTDEPVRIASITDIGLGDRVAVAIRKDEEVLGYIWALEVEKPIDDNGIQQLKKAAQTAKQKLLHIQTRKRKQEEGYQEFFWQLLTGHLTTEAAVRDKAAQIHLTLPPAFYVAVFEFSESIDDHRLQQIRYLMSVTQRISVVCHAVDHHHFILLASPSESTSWKEHAGSFITHFGKQMHDRFRVSAMASACGSLYEDYGKVETSYREALTLLRLKKLFPNQTKIHHYEDLGFYRFLPPIFEYKQSHRMVNRHLQRLKEYDRDHHTNLLDTLETFLMHDSNAKEAAAALHIHTNTMNYRLSRIAEIGEIDLKSMDQKVALYIDLKTNKLMSS
ncbi:PucR family transcriptional regulator [Paenibacillus elgii]|uniref:PucR family transcriptional regulator n=1 Tax=Paenibacillus elgii TaxID=189691 RepID=A0A163YRU8_9BACL|nr:helix-turn-helix domain-containing protein [Paenibacillus elgii]KZE80158.1 PucR family transcriptional regulator [Paenibacillus elgii]NEN83443.1 PucR family transcriptional regulator [Paenibacillus elgii]